MSHPDNEDGDEFYDSETEPSFCEDEAENDTDIVNSLGKLSIKSGSAKPVRASKHPAVTIFAVQLSNKSKINGNIAINSSSIMPTTAMSNNRIFINQENAMKLCKEDPENRRFKSFKSFHEAYTFSYETSEIESGQAPSLQQVQAELNLISPLINDCRPQNQGPSLTPVKANTPKAIAVSNQDAERLPFSAPKKPEINELRSFIENNLFEQFRDKVIANPRFLISAGDAPVAVQVTKIFRILY